MTVVVSSDDSDSGITCPLTPRFPYLAHPMPHWVGGALIGLIPVDWVGGGCLLFPRQTGDLLVCGNGLW